MTPASEEFAEIARRLNEIKAERTRVMVGEPEQPVPATTEYPVADYGDCC